LIYSKREGAAEKRHGRKSKIENKISETFTTEKMVVCPALFDAATFQREQLENARIREVRSHFDIFGLCILFSPPINKWEQATVLSMVTCENWLVAGMSR
jgi:hypothetical protein